MQPAKDLMTRRGRKDAPLMPGSIMTIHLLVSVLIVAVGGIVVAIESCRRAVGEVSIRDSSGAVIRANVVVASDCIVVITCSNDTIWQKPNTVVGQGVEGAARALANTGTGNSSKLAVGRLADRTGGSLRITVTWALARDAIGIRVSV